MRFIGCDLHARQQMKERRARSSRLPLVPTSLTEGG
jgi:hypothetical protein